MRSRMLSALALAAMVAFASAVPAAAHSKTHKDAPKTEEIQILNVSDWHAQLDPLNGVGGAAALSTYWESDRAANPNTLTLTGGDAYGASPPLSGFFDEEPAVKAMNLMGFDADTFGNHNFDRGIEHLQRMIDLAEFSYVSANLRDEEDELDGVAPYKIFRVGKTRVAVIGITNPEAPTLVFPGRFGSIELTDPVTAAEKARQSARRRGADVFVVIAHLGVTGTDAQGNPSGPLVDFARAVEGFDVILGDHTDIQYQERINGALVLENKSKGVTYARTTLTVRKGKGDVLDSESEFVTPTASAVTPDPAIVEMLQPYRTALAAEFDTRIGSAAGVFPRNGVLERTGEAAIGNIVADALRLRYGTQLALTNGGGLRAALPSSYVPADTTLDRTAPAPFDLVIGDVFTVLPFGNVVVTRTVTGSQLYAALENGVSATPGANGRFPQISGFRFTYDSRLPAGSRVQSATLDGGTPIQRDGTVYTLATNDFVNLGGDGYAVLNDGTGTTREVMADVLLQHIQTQGTVTPVIDGRIDDLATP
jgi:5'-nucleotidase